MVRSVTRIERWLEPTADPIEGIAPEVKSERYSMLQIVSFAAPVTLAKLAIHNLDCHSKCESTGTLGQFHSNAAKVSPAPLPEQSEC